MAAMSPSQWLWTEQSLPDAFAVVLLHVSNSQRQSFHFHNPQFARVHVTGHALRPGHFGVLTGQFSSHQGEVTTGFLVLDFATGTFKLVNTGLFVPSHPAVTSDGTIWTIGWERDGKQESTSDFPAVRAFAATGAPRLTSLPRHTLGNGSLSIALGSARTFASGDEYFAHLPGLNQIFRFRASGETQAIPAPPMPGKVRSIGIAFCGGHLFLNAMSNEANFSFVQSPGGPWEELTYYSGEQRQQWLPQYPYCSPSGRAVGILGFDNLSEIHLR